MLKLPIEAWVLASEQERPEPGPSGGRPMPDVFSLTEPEVAEHSVAHMMMEEHEGHRR